MSPDHRACSYSVIRWLDVTPVGRIVTRCTSDMSAIEERFTYWLTYFMHISLQVVSILGASVLTIGLWALVPGLIIFTLGLVVGLIYLKCQISITRERK